MEADDAQNLSFKQGGQSLLLRKHIAAAAMSRKEDLLAEDTARSLQAEEISPAPLGLLF